MSYKKIINIIQKIHTKTNNDLIEWETTEESGIYQVSFSTYSIRISERQSYSTPEEHDFIIQIINNMGDIVEEVSDEDIASSLEKAYHIMKSTYELARRKAMGVDLALDTILDELENEL
mgnify:CR=1 FL=1